MKSILPFDELNKLPSSLRKRFPDGKLLVNDRSEIEDIIDELLDLFLLAYSTGNRVTEESLSSSWEPSLDDVMRIVDERVAGKTWRERVEEYFANEGSVDDLLRIAETETHRIANESAWETATNCGASTKTWLTMLDDKVRDNHTFLEGQTIPVDADFYTPDGDHARAPGLFALPENNCGCRCELTYK